MALLDAEFIKRCGGLRRAASRRPTRRFLGRSIRKALAGGTETTGYIDYSSGNDFRYVDWNRAARLDELVSRQFHGRQDEEVYFFLDASGSMKLPNSAGVTKFEYARQLAAAVAYVARANLDHVRFIAFAGGQPTVSPRIFRSYAAARMCAFLNELQAEGESTDLTAAVEDFVVQKFKQGLVVVISDLFDSAGFSRPLDLLREYGYEPFVVHLLSPADIEPGEAGRTAMIDVESGTRRGVFLDDEDLENYAEVFDEFCESVQAYCRRRRIGTVRVTTDIPVEKAVERMLRFGRSTA